METSISISSRFMLASAINGSRSISVDISISSFIKDESALIVSLISFALADRHPMAYGIIVANDSMRTLSVLLESSLKIGSGTSATTSAVSSPTPTFAVSKGT